MTSGDWAPPAAQDGHAPCMTPSLPAESAESRAPLWLFASLWSLRHYPTRSGEWSAAKKFAAIRAAGFEGVFSPPVPALADRGSLRYLAVTSLRRAVDVAATLGAAKALGALAIDVQLGEPRSRPAEVMRILRRLRAVASELDLPFAIETHRGTITETPEATLAVARAYRLETGETLPLCLDHSHFAVVRHLAPGSFWEQLCRPTALLSAATQFHLRPFNGHHCQIPVTTPAGRRTPEYQVWLPYADALFTHLHRRGPTQPVLVVPELGHAAPAYRLSCFGDTWGDVQVLAGDLRRAWRRAGRRD